MIITSSSASPSKARLDALLIVTGFSASSRPWKSLEAPLVRLCDEADPKRQFRGKLGSLFLLPTLGCLGAETLALLGLGDSKDPAAQQRSFGKAIRELQRRKVRSLGVVFAAGAPPVSADILVQSAEEATYHFKTYSPDRDTAPTELQKLLIFDATYSQSKLHAAHKVACAVRYARDLANQPPNVFHPATLADEARRLAKKRHLKCEVWEEPRLRREKFGGILAVGQGSVHPPRFIRLDYRGAGKKQSPYVIVGKAITFDTGGISIKPSDRMDEMKFDKCGGIAVLGILDAVAALKLPINLTGLISSAENMPGGNAYRPGDLVKSLSGKYIEVLNTDAEGRIVLADALTYAQRLHPRAIVDMATLTGACIICFGHECAAVLGNRETLVEQLRDAARSTGEKIWPLPLWSEYQEKVKSDVGYVKNTAGREGGTITAACFLNAFVNQKIPWAHVDIAGVAWTSREDSHRAKGATMFGVRLITRWLTEESQK